MEYKRFGGKLLVRIDKDEEIGETNLIFRGTKMSDVKEKTGAVLRETGSPDRGRGHHCGGGLLFSGAEPCIRQQYFRPWHRAVQFCAAAACRPLR